MARKNIHYLKECIPNVMLSADIITGFPGETDEEFNETLAFVKKVGFAWIHVFPYSKREGTVADKMPDQLNKEIKTKRAHNLSTLANEKGKEYRVQFIGKTKSVLCETNENNIQSGLTKEHILVQFESAPIENEIVKVKITKVTKSGLWGERIN